MVARLSQCLGNVWSNSLRFSICCVFLAVLLLLRKMQFCLFVGTTTIGRIAVFAPKLRGSEREADSRRSGKNRSRRNVCGFVFLEKMETDK